MSYSAPNTPNPLINTQIGFSMNLLANTVTTTTANVIASLTTTTFNIPIGEWIIIGNCLVAGTLNANVAIGGTCTITASSGGTVFADTGFSSPSQTVSYMYFNPTGCFYSDGNLDINVRLTATSSSTSTTARTSASLQIIKIA